MPVQWHSANPYLTLAAKEGPTPLKAENGPAESRGQWATSSTALLDCSLFSRNVNATLLLLRVSVCVSKDLPSSLQLALLHCMLFSKY